MSLIGATLDEFAAPFKTIFASDTEYVGADFTEGFVVEEILPGDDGVSVNSQALRIVFIGEWMPHQPFKWGGTQKLVKEYYPGNPEPTVQVLGSRENDLKVAGRFKVKRLKNVDTDTGRGFPTLLAEACDTIRKRGNLVRITLGDWERYGFLESCDFTMKTLADIEYELSFFIVGDTPPTNCKLADEGAALPLDLNRDLILAASQMEALATPDFDVELGLLGTLNTYIGGVATVLKVLTTFVDTAIRTAEDVEKLANRAVGLVKYAQATIAVFKRRIGALSIPTLGTTGTGASATGSAADKATDDIKAGKYIMTVQNCTAAVPALSDAQKADAKTKTAAYTPRISFAEAAASAAGGKSVDEILAAMLAKFQKLAQRTPRFRHLVRSGDTLQTISMKYYKTVDGWDKIMTHNHLQSTQLVVGSILEIPSL